MNISLTINGIQKSFEIYPEESLVDALRRNGYSSVKRACDSSSCGSCTVLLDEVPVLSCSMLAARAEGHQITTVEGIHEEAANLAEFLTAEGAEQCGFCSPGLVLCLHAMKNELQNPSMDDIKHYLAGNLCRCSGYEGQLRAIKKYLGGQVS